eukprot:m.55561 g.55561  ORF g.55561 m.55561 type:complete len:309 (+) comp10989_c0_seq3:91-1017(+)
MEEKEFLVLKSRVEQQADLIMTLKRRNDELQASVDKVKEQHAQSERDRISLKIDYEQQAESYRTLQDRFSTLSQNHTELIVIKDGHKNARKRLEEECGTLTKKLETLSMTLTSTHAEEISGLRECVKGLEEKLKASESERQSVENQMKTLEKTYEEQETKRKSEALLESNEKEKALNVIKEALKKSEEELDNNRKTSQDKLNALELKLVELQAMCKELESSKNAAVNRENELQDLVTEHSKTIAKFQKQIADKTAEEQEYASKAKDTSTPEYALEKLRKEYAAYKVHSSELLRKEKEMNTRLRKLQSS